MDSEFDNGIVKFRNKILTSLQTVIQSNYHVYPDPSYTIHFL